MLVHEPLSLFTLTINWPALATQVTVKVRPSTSEDFVPDALPATRLPIFASLHYSSSMRLSYMLVRS